MPRERSRNQTESGMSSQLRLLQDAAAGRLDNLDCPNCEHAPVSVWFTHPAADTYRSGLSAVTVIFILVRRIQTNLVFFRRSRERGARGARFFHPEAVSVSKATARIDVSDKDHM